MAKAAYVGAPNFEPVTLPSGYTQLEYLESTGTQYIDSGVVGSSNTRVIADFAITGLGSGTTFVFGAQGTDSVRYTLGITSAGVFRSDYGTEMTSGKTAVLNTRYKADKNQNVCTVNDSTITSTAQTFTGTTNIYLFARSYSSLSYSQIKLYSCKIYSNGTMVRNMIPAKNSSGTLGLYDTVNGAFYTNAGTGTFTAGGTYAEVARKVKKIYLGIDNIARKVKKGYIGDANGLARLFFAGFGEMSYYGEATSLSGNRYDMAATEVGDYAIFGGGRDSSNGADDTVYAYNKSLVQTVATSLTQARARLAAASIGNYALFAGGYYYYNNKAVYSTVDAYNASLTRSTPTAMNTGMHSIGAAVIGNYAIFAGGGRELVNDVTGLSTTCSMGFCAYNASLTRKVASTAQYLSKARYALAGASVGNYAIFAGGCTSNSAGTAFVALNNVDAYNGSLTKSTPSSLSTSRYYLAGAHIGDYALFAGGFSSAAVDAYDASLTRSLPTALSQSRGLIAATEIGDYAIFAGGCNSGYGSHYNTVDAYDPSLTRTILPALPTGRSAAAAATIGDFALICGGRSGSTSNNTTAYAYKFSA